MSASKIKVPVLCLIAIIVILAMLRLGVWQLDRAEQKREIQADMQSKASLDAIDLADLLADSGGSDLHNERYRPIKARGEYLQSSSIFIDSEVLNGKVGYKVVTPFKLLNSDVTILVDRGWVFAGHSRDTLPLVDTPEGEQNLFGRINLPKSRPPIWKDEYPTFQDKVWQFLPIDEYSQWSGNRVLPMILELQESTSTSDLLIQWQEMGDYGIATHQGYAFQWFAMALGFFICCIVVLLRSISQRSD